MFRTLPRHEEDGLGLPYPVILLDGAEEEIDDRTGEQVGISIPNMEGLIAAVAIARSLHPLRLDGSEVRFIRRAIGMSAADFAAALTLDAATLSRWENNRQTVGEWADKQVRFYAVTALRDRVGVPVDADALIRLRTFEREGGDWPTIELKLKPPVARQQEASIWGTERMAA